MVRDVKWQRGIAELPFLDVGFGWTDEPELNHGRALISLLFRFGGQLFDRSCGALATGPTPRSPTLPASRAYYGHDGPLMNTDQRQ